MGKSKSIAPPTSDGLTPTRRGRFVLQGTAVLLGIVGGFVSYIFKADLQLSIWLGLAIALGVLVVETTSVTVALARAVTDTNAKLDELRAAADSRDTASRAIAHTRGSGNAGRQLADTLEQLHESVAKAPSSLLRVVDEVLHSPVEALRAGHLIVPGSSASLGSHLVRNFRSQVFTTSFHPLDFWLTTYGRNYHTEICNRLQTLSETSSVDFRRVFIVRPDAADELRTNPYLKIVREQTKCGIDVRVCYESDLSADLCIDFGLWDGELEVELECDNDRRIVRRHYRYSRDALVSAQRRAERIWDRAIKFDQWFNSKRRTNRTSSP